MIYCINVRNVNQALAQGLRWLATRGQADDSRNGDVLVSPMPVITCYNRPDERVLFSPLRDANPFFHFMEAIWMLAGRNDIAFLTQFNKRYAEYSDDGQIAWGAYGWRWRGFFGYDQLPIIINELRANPQSRRCVLSMWQPSSDPGVPDLTTAMNGGKDVPCNTNIFFRIRKDQDLGPVLDMQVNNRSNDVIWGAYGANAVHMTILHEFVAHAVGVGVGRHYQSSWNFHAYTNIYPAEGYQRLAEDALLHDYYTARESKSLPLFGAAERWEDILSECELFCDGESEACTSRIIQGIAVPMLDAWRLHKAKDYAHAVPACAKITAPDWRKACTAWIERRAMKWEMKGVPQN